MSHRYGQKTAEISQRWTAAPTTAEGAVDDRDELCEGAWTSSRFDDQLARRRRIDIVETTGNLDLVQMLVFWGITV